MNALSQAMNAILAAELPPATERTAIRLLAKASATGGQYNCTWADFLALCGCDNRNAGRRHLTHIVNKGIIHYSTNEYVYVTFLAWMPAPDAPPTARGRAETEAGDHQNGACTRQNDDGDVRIVSDGDAKRRVGALLAARGRAEMTYEILERERERDYIINTTEQSLSLSRNDLQPEQQRVFDALTDPEVNIQPANAIKVAQYMKLRLVLLMIGTWWPEREKYSAGALFKRLMNPGKFRPGVPGKDFLASEFYARHYPDDGITDLPPPTRQPSAWEGVILA